MKDLKFRTLEAHEIECRVSRCTKSGAFFLLYKDARCDQSILDETVGVLGWQRKHSENKGNLFCAVGIYDSDKNEWVWKEDCGTESNTEKEKGEASDSFKRACFNWGIGRELYTKINIFIRGITKDSGKTNKYSDPVYELSDPYAKFHVSEIVTDAKTKKILHLVISDDKDIQAFTWDSKEYKSPSYTCKMCGKSVSRAIYEGCVKANNGNVYCSGTCKSKDVVDGT